MKERNILCIDLKSFFASCECVNRGLDPFTTPLVVADTSRGNGAMTLRTLTDNCINSHDPKVLENISDEIFIIHEGSLQRKL